MRIAIIGTGHVGTVLGTGLANHGHQIVFGSREPDRADVRELVGTAGPNARATRPREAVEDADVAVIALPWHAVKSTLKALGPLKDKILIDCTNPLGPGMSLVIGHDTSAAEQIAEWAPGAHVVKNFSTTGAQNMSDPVYGVQRLAMFLCGDNEGAKKVACSLAEELGFQAIDCGPLKQARYLEPMAVVWINLAYSQGFGPDFGFAVLRRP